MPSFLRCVGLPATSLGFSGSDPHTVEAFSASSCDVPDGRLAVECISQPTKNALDEPVGNSKDWLNLAGFTLYP